MCIKGDLTFIVIALGSLLIILTDTIVLKQIIDKSDMIQSTSDPYLYQICYKPQIRLRIVFTAYAIVASSICFMLSSVLLVIGEQSSCFLSIVKWITEFTYVAFGPILFTFCAYGLISLPRISYHCDTSKLVESFSIEDHIILLLCTAVSFAIVFMYALKFTNDVI